MENSLTLSRTHREDKEETILMLLSTNPERGMELLVKEYAGCAFAIANDKLGGFARQDVEECVSDIFYEVYRCRNRIDRTRGSLKAFVCTVAKRRALDSLRALYRRRNGEKLREDAPQVPGAQSEVLRNEQRQALLAAVRSLPQREAQIVTRHFYLGQTYKEIGVELDMKENTVCRRCLRALEKLRAMLDQEDFIDE